MAPHSANSNAPCGRKGRSEKPVLDDKEFLSLLRKLQKILPAPEERPEFWPDTIVGVLEVSDGADARRFYFAADPDQAKTQDKSPSPELSAVVNAIYAICTKLTGSRSVKP